MKSWRLTDEVTVLRDGVAVLRSCTSDIDESRLAESIAGRAIEGLKRLLAQERSATSATMLELKNLASSGKLSPVSLNVKAGEVIGIAGFLGSGRSELLHAIFGADPDATGDVFIENKRVGRSTMAAVAASMALVPEDRMGQGLVPTFEIWRNTSLPALSGVSWRGWLPVRHRETERAPGKHQALEHQGAIGRCARHRTEWRQRAEGHVRQVAFQRREAVLAR